MKHLKLLLSFTILTTCQSVEPTISHAQSWTLQNVGFHTPGTNPFKVSIVDSNVAWCTAVIDHGFPKNREFSVTLDGGAHWNCGSVSNDTDYTVVEVSAISQNLAYVLAVNETVGYPGAFLKTTDGGATWNEIGAGTLFTDPASFCTNIYFWDGANGIMKGDPDMGVFEIYTTTDSGNHWTRVPSADIPPALPGEHGYAWSWDVHGNTIWFGTSRGRVYRSTDRGNTWSVFTAAANKPVYLCFLDDGLTGLALIYSSVALTTWTYVRTLDGGETWSPLTPNGYMYENARSIPGTHIFVSSDFLPTPAGSSYSLDSGRSWIRIDSAGLGTTRGYCGVAFHDINTGYANGWTDDSLMGGIYKWNRGNIGLDVNPVKTAESDLIAYPIPVRDRLNLTGLESGEPVYLTDVLGKPLVSFTTQKSDATIDMSKLPAGIYFVRTAKRSSKVAKM